MAANFEASEDDVYRYARGGDGCWSRDLRNSTAGHYLTHVCWDQCVNILGGCPNQHPESRRADAFAYDTFQLIMQQNVSISFLRFARSLATELYVSIDFRHDERLNLLDYTSIERSLWSAYKIQSFDSVLRLLEFSGSVASGGSKLNRALWPQGNWQCRLTSGGLHVRNMFQEGAPFPLGGGPLEYTYFNASSLLTSLTFDWVIFQQGMFETRSAHVQIVQERLVSWP